MCSTPTPILFRRIVRICQAHHYVETDVCHPEQYVKVLVKRYKDSPTVFAWELMNEARCLGDLPGSSACGMDTGLITKWYKQQSDYVRSL